MLLPTYDVFDDARYFVPGDAPRLTAIGGCNVSLTTPLWHCDLASLNGGAAAR